MLLLLFLLTLLLLLLLLLLIYISVASYCFYWPLIAVAVVPVIDPPPLPSGVFFLDMNNTPSLQGLGIPPLSLLSPASLVVG